MNAMSINYFRAVEYIKKLREADFTEEQAEAVVELIGEQSQIIQEYGTKINYLESKEPATKADFRETELRLQNE